MTAWPASSHGRFVRPITVGAALLRLAELDPSRVKLAKAVAEAEKAEAAAFEQAKPASAAELARRQWRASVARDVMSDRRGLRSLASYSANGVGVGIAQRADEEGPSLQLVPPQNSGFPAHR